ncbi:MAG: hypothetical protein ACYDAC_00255 [Candidatus Dormibacteria bacterium]
MHRQFLAALPLVALAACGGTAPASAPTSTAPATPGSASSATAAPAREPRLVLSDDGTSGANPMVRLAGLDATDVASVKGRFIAVVDNQVVVLDGITLEAVNYDGTVRQLGSLAATAHGAIVVSPDVTHWLYTVYAPQAASEVHEGSSAGDHVIRSIPSPDNNATYQPYAWNASGAYMVLTPTGLGGAGPFSPYHFPLYRFDVSTGATSGIAPACLAWAVLADDSLICSLTTAQSNLVGLDERTSSGGDHQTHVDGPFDRLTLSADQTRFALAAKGGTSASPEYQVRVGQVGGADTSPFGAAGYRPTTWLPDGRLVEEAFCFGFTAQTTCDYSQPRSVVIYSADGSSSTPFYKVSATTNVVGALA